MPTILLLHGMGDHDAESFKGEFIAGCNNAFGLYSSLTGQSIEDHANIVSIDYNYIFNKRREAMANEASSLSEKLSSIADIFESGLTDLLVKINELESSLNDDDFLYTHLLDVYFYRYTILSELVRVHVGEEIAKAIAGGSSRDVHIVAHSLGTAVAHDTLARLYGDTGVAPLNGTQLSTATHKLGSLHMVANTSRVLETHPNIFESLVKPGPGGCASKFYEYKHTLDPITWVKPFTPSDNNGWINHDSFRLKRYRLIQPTSVTSVHGHVHSIGHYLFNPLVHQPLFRAVTDIDLTKDQLEKGRDAFISQTLSAVSRDLEDAIDDLRFGDQNSVESLIVAGKKLKDFVEALGGSY